MKTLTKVFALFALLFTACSEPEVVEPQNPDVEQGVSLSEVNVKIDNSYTRVAAVAGNVLQMYWSSEDKIALTDYNTIAQYTLTQGVGSVNAKFSGQLESDSEVIYALYPSEGTTISGNKIVYTIPTEQNYLSSKDANIGVRAPMFGSAKRGETITVSGVASALKFDITLAQQNAIEAVTVTSSVNNLTGKATLTPSSSLSGGDSKSVTLVYTKPTKGSTKDGWAAIVPTNFKADKLLVDVDTDKTQYRFCISTTASLAAGDVYSLKIVESDFEQVESKDNLAVGQFWSSAGLPEKEEVYEPGSIAKGVVKYSDGSPAVGVSISDGFSVVQTDQYGKFSLTPHQDAWYIYYSLPADCQTVVNDKGQPHFFIKYEKNRFEYNFTLTRGTKEEVFSLFCLADPQCSNSAGRSRFQKESVPHIKALAEKKGIPCYGVTLGDIVSSGDSSNTNPQMPYMRDHMSISNTGIPIYQTMGNHDYLYFNGSQPIEPDETSSTYNIKAQRLFEDTFGPINHSWNRSDTHIVCMRDMLWNSNNAGGDYSLGFSDEQYEWLKQDLSFVPKDKLVILCVHIPLVNSSNKNIQKVIALLASFNEAHIMAGHTHYTRNEPTLSSGVYEHVHGAVCGAWWHSNTNGDGTPNGYGVYDIRGNRIYNWYYQGVNTGMNDRDYQIRLYRGDHRSGGKYEYFAQQHGDGVLLANVFNADDSWTVKVYEDGVYSGQMSKIAYKKETPTKGTGIDNPTKPSTKSSQDWWAIGHLVGVKNRSRGSYFTSCFHLYKYTLKNKNASIRVEATDRFGRTYSQTKIMDDYEYTLLDNR
jgi:hypothetical protein